MSEKIYKFIISILCLILMQTAIIAQEFTVDNSSENTYSGGGAWDGTNFLLSVVNVVAGQHNIELQLIAPGPALLGSRISTGKIGNGTMIAFDGTNYLMVWTDTFPFFAGGDTNGIGNIYGQFINTSGQLIGATINIVSDVNIKFGQGRGSFLFNENDSTYFVTYLKGGPHQDYLYGQCISKSGVLFGNPLKISDNYAREHAVSCDGTDYLVAWCDGSGPDEVIYGQLVGGSGELVGNNFLIDGTSNKSDNPMSMDYDGNQYFLLFHDQSADNGWNIIGRFISKAGVVSANRIIICDSTQTPAGPTIAFDGTEHLITWMETKSEIRVKARFFNKSGIPINDEFIAFDTLDGKSAVGGVGVAKETFLLGAIRMDSLAQDCDIYIRIIDPLTGIEKIESDQIPAGFTLYQNYPNPFNPSTKLRYALQSESRVSITIYNLLGQEMIQLLNKIEKPGIHELTYNAINLSSGIYYYRMVATSKDGRNTISTTKKLILLK